MAKTQGKRRVGKSAEEYVHGAAVGVDRRKKKALLGRPTTPVKIEADTTVSELLDQYRDISFQARALGRCAEVFEKALRDKDRPTIFLGLAGSLIAAGMRQVIVDLVENNMVDVIVSTGAIVSQDYYQVRGGRHYHGTPDIDDRMLRDLYIDRLYDTFIDEEKYWETDMAVSQFADRLAGKALSSRAFLRLLARMAAEDAAPVPLLAVLKHPLAAGGMAPEAFRGLARRLEAAIRGPRPAPGFTGLRAALGKIGDVRSLAEAQFALGAKGGVLSSLLAAAMREGRLSAGISSDAGIKERAASSFAEIVRAEARRIRLGMGVLATIGATSPFVGLFGTVWGIMNSFIGISKAHTTNLAVVAPGIAEALLATALGLLTAIPAVIAYNLFTSSLREFAARCDDFSLELVNAFERTQPTVAQPAYRGAYAPEVRE